MNFEKHPHFGRKAKIIRASKFIGYCLYAVGIFMLGWIAAGYFS